MVERMRALRGTSWVVLTLRHTLKRGMPPSRLNAHVQREAAVSEPTVAKNQMPRTG
jgi:hypothetical protein